MNEQVILVVDHPFLVGLLLQILVGWWSVVGLVSIIRVAPVVRGWVARGIKPWSCDLCMSFWTSLLCIGTLGAVHGEPQSLVLVPAMTALSLFTLSRLTVAPPGGPVDLPPLVDTNKSDTE